MTCRQNASTFYLYRKLPLILATVERLLALKALFLMTVKNPLRPLGFCALVLCGCSPASHSSAASGASAQTAAPHISQPRGFSTGNITDPTMNGTTAYTMTIPADWKLQGVVTTSPCTSIPRAVYRAYAADGLTEMRQTPALAWKWYQNPRLKPDQGCLPYPGAMSAADFLGKYAETIEGGVHVVGPMPVEPAFKKAADDYTAVLSTGANNFAARTGGQPTAHFTNDVAALHIQTINGTFVIDQRLRTMVQCENDTGIIPGGNCWAQVEILRAPKGKLDALVHLVDSNNLPNIQPDLTWRQAEMKIIYDRGQAGLAHMREMYEAGTRAQKAMFDEFMETTTRNHEEFMNEQESRFESSMNNAQNAQNARVTAGSDMVDYALDQQTVVGPGGYAKVSNAYAHTWSSTVGNQTQWYQTDDPTTNPNGVRNGTWTEDVKVHGNGQPY